jgi:hypothetical protein
MKYRKLRIAWSVAWGVVAVLLCVLWVRSHRVRDVFSFVDSWNHFISAGSNNGTVYFQLSGTGDHLSSFYGRWIHVSGDASEPGEVFKWQPNTPGLWGGSICFPHWFSILLIAVLTAAPWIGRRFSLRTLLIAMTLVAVGLGLIVYAMR